MSSRRDDFRFAASDSAHRFGRRRIAVVKPLPCPFCGNAAEARWDAPEPRPFVVRCGEPTCPGHTSVSFADADVALERWQRRAQMPPVNPQRAYAFCGFTTRSLLRGELVQFGLDRTGVVCSDAFRFDPHSRPLMLKPPE